METSLLSSDEILFPHVEKYGIVHPYPEHYNKFSEDVLRKIVFSITKPASKLESVNPGLLSIARLLNIYELEQISYKRYEVTAVIYGEAITSVLENDVYNGMYFINNPNIELISSLKKAKVKLIACWQSMQDNNYTEDMILKDVEITNCALNALLYYQQNHYNLIPM
jgi:intracellular sulfur oxidation DsrE/DsrF family protein